MDTLMAGKRSRRARSRLRPRRSAAASCRRRKSRARRRRRRRSTCPRAPTSPTDVHGLHAAVPRLPRRQGHLARRHRRLHQRDRAVPQPVAVPPREGRRRERRRVQGAHPPDAARRSSTIAKAEESLLVPAVAWGYFPVNSDGNDLVVWTDDDRTQRAAALHVPAPAEATVPLHRRLLPARRVGRRRLRRVPRGDDGLARPASASSELFAADRYQEYLLLHGLSVEMTEALAELLAPPHPRGVGLRRRGRPDARGAVPPAVPRVALLVGLPRVPRPRRPGEGRRAARDRPHRRDAHRGVPARARAEHLGDHRPPPRGEVLRRVAVRAMPFVSGRVRFTPPTDRSTTQEFGSKPIGRRRRRGVHQAKTVAITAAPPSGSTSAGAPWARVRRGPESWPRTPRLSACTVLALETATTQIPIAATPRVVIVTLRRAVHADLRNTSQQRGCIDDKGEGQPADLAPELRRRRVHRHACRNPRVPMSCQAEHLPPRESGLGDASISNGTSGPQ